MSCYYGPSCVPSCTIPTYIPSCGTPMTYPVGGLGSLSSSGGIYSGLGGIYSGSGGISSGSLGLTSGASPSCIGQLPPSEIIVQPSPCIVTIPGAILSASCEPTRVGGYTACGGSGVGGSSISSRLGVARRVIPSSVCNLPC